MDGLLGSALIDEVERLDQRRAQRFLAGLLGAEVSLLSLRTEHFRIANDERIRDGGVDVWLDLPAASSTPFPVGKTIWQFKTGTTKPSASEELAAGKKDFARTEIADGADYVLLWTGSPPPQGQTKIKADFERAVREIRADADVHLVFAPHLAELAVRHPSVAALIDRSGLALMQRYEQWRAMLRGVDIPFLEDDARKDLREEIRELASGASTQHALHVLGNAGVGKSRLVLEALGDEPLRERVLYARTPSGIPPTLAAWAASRPGSHLVLVVDECSLLAAQGLHSDFAAADGRVRVVTLGDRGVHREWTGGGYVRELPPLDVRETAEQLEGALGLSADRARFVAQHAEGYPQLAWQLAELLLEGSAKDVTRLTRKAVIGALLERMLPSEEHRDLLGMLAIFDRLGFSNALAPETTAACEAFRVEESAFRVAVEKERDVVRTAGRYRHVTPLLLASWIGGEWLAKRREDLGARLAKLPPELFDRFAQQFEYFGPHEAARQVVRDWLAPPAAMYSTLESLSGQTGRFLRAAAAVDRALVAETIERLCRENRAELAALRGRRDVVWALEYLLWFDDTFERALTPLFYLALDETEEIANNSRGTITGAFRIFLGGTSVPWAVRLETLRRLVGKEDSDDARGLLLMALGHAFESQESRGVPAITGGVLLPDEWRPATWGEVAEIREQAWSLALETVRAVRDSATRQEQALTLIRSLRMVLLGVSDRSRVLSGVMQLVAETGARARALTAEQLQLALEHDEPPDDLKALFESTLAELRGSDLESTLEYLLASEPWEITRGTDDPSRSPAELTEAAAALVDAPDRLPQAIELAASSETNTAGLLFDMLGREDNTRNEWIDLFIKRDPLPVLPLAGFLSGRDQAGQVTWVDQQLQRLNTDERLRSAFPSALYAVTATDDRAALATEGIEAGRYEGAQFARMLYGAWARPLSEPIFIALVRAIASDPRAHEAALGMVSQYVDDRGEGSDELSDLIVDLLEGASIDPGDRTMLSHYRGRLLSRVELDFETELVILLRSLQHRETFPRESEHNSLHRLLKRDAGKTVRAIATAILEDVRQNGWSKWAMWIEEMHFLTRATTTVGPEPVRAALSSFSEDELAVLMPHFNFDGSVPDPVLVEAIENATSEDLLAAARSRFLHTPSGWSGSRVPVSQRRRSDAVAWSEAGGPNLKSWALNLMPYYDAEIEREQLRDEEDPFR